MAIETVGWKEDKRVLAESRDQENTEEERKEREKLEQTLSDDGLEKQRDSSMNL